MRAQLEVAGVENDVDERSRKGGTPGSGAEGRGRAASDALSQRAQGAAGVPLHLGGAAAEGGQKCVHKSLQSLPCSGEQDSKGWMHSFLVPTNGNTT